LFADVLTKGSRRVTVINESAIFYNPCTLQVKGVQRPIKIGHAFLSPHNCRQSLLQHWIMCIHAPW